MAMGITSLTSRESNQDAARAKKAALTGSVFITDCGRPAHVLLSIDEYHWLTGKGETLCDIASRREGGDVAFDPPKLDVRLRPADPD